MKRTIATAIVVALAVVGSASATESTIYPGGGIGKVKLGMTQAQVEKVLGHDYLVNARWVVGGVPYRELAWNFASWSVGFLRSGGTWRVAQVETTVFSQRTLSGIGVSSPFKQVVQKYSHLICAGISTTYGGGRTGGTWALILVRKGPVYTAFAIEPVVRTQYDGPWRVYAVLVQRSVPGHVSLVSIEKGNGEKVPLRCRTGWQERGTP